MTKVGIKCAIIAAIALFIALVVGVIVLLSPVKVNEPEFLNTEFMDEILADSGAKGAEPTNGAIGSIQLGNEVVQLVAQPDDGYVFAYWMVNTTTNPNLKLCADEVIRVDSTRSDEFTPIFVAETNVVNITTLEDSTLKSDITNNRTAGKVYNLTQDCVLSASFAPLGTFKGILKGNGHKVKGLNINHTTTGTGTGLFEALDGAVISELYVASGSITSVRANVGTIAGVINNSLISRCVSNISVVSTNESGVVGGIVGKNNSTKSMIYCSEFGGSINGTIRNAIAGQDANIMLYKNKYNGAIYTN